MIKKVKMFTVICDNCGCDAGEDQDFSCYGNTIFAESAAMESEWLKEGKKHYCPDCFSYDNGNKLLLKKE